MTPPESITSSAMKAAPSPAPRLGPSAPARPPGGWRTAPRLAGPAEAPVMAHLPIRDGGKEFVVEAKRHRPQARHALRIAVTVVVMDIQFLATRYDQRGLGIVALQIGHRMHGHAANWCGSGQPASACPWRAPIEGIQIPDTWLSGTSRTCSLVPLEKKCGCYALQLRPAAVAV
jgi:hypothetical protein